MGKNPAFQFYPGDWTRDLDDQDLEVEGAWIRICCRLWWSDTPGEMTKPLKEWARILRKTEKKTTKIFQILFEKRIASGSVLDNQNITIISRRMVRDAEISKLRREVGKLGGNPELKKNMKNLDNQTFNQNLTPSSSTSIQQLDTISSIGNRGEILVNQNHSSEYLNLFPGKKTIQTFDDRGENKKLARVFHFDGNMPTRYATELSYLNENKAGIYLTVNETDGKGRKASNVIKVRSLFADLDGVPLAPAMKFNPSLIVESSSTKYHCYWFTRDTPVEAFSVMQEQIARILSSDPKVKDLPRVMRIPGFYHNKEEPFLTKICSVSGVIYSYRELVEMFPPEQRAQWSARAYKLDKSSSSAKEEFRGVYGASEGERNDHVLKRIGGMIKRGCSWSYIESEALKEGLACQPPLSEDEVMQILKSARKYA